MTQAISTQQLATSANGAMTKMISSFLRLQFVNYGILPALLIILIIAFAVIEPRFLSTGNLINVSRQLSFLGIISIAQMYYLVTGNYDLSNGATVALSSVSAALVMTSVSPEDPGTAILLGILVGLSIGLIVGIINAVLIAVFNISSFMVTLGMGSVATGFALLLSGGAPVVGLPSEFSLYLGRSTILGLPSQLIMLIVMIVLAYLLMHWTKWGRQAYAVGGNMAAAYQSGVNVKRTLILMMVLGSLLSAFVGIILTARLSTGEANIGLQYPLVAIIACVIGGITLSGGEGRVSGAVMGALFIILLSNGMDLIRVQSHVQDIMLGVLLAVALLVDRLRSRVKLQPKKVKAAERSTKNSLPSMTVGNS